MKNKTKKVKKIIEEINLRCSNFKKENSWIPTLGYILLILNIISILIISIYVLNKFGDSMNLAACVIVPANVDTAIKWIFTLPSAFLMMCNVPKTEKMLLKMATKIVRWSLVLTLAVIFNVGQ